MKNTLNIFSIALLSIACVGDLDFDKFDEIRPGPNLALPILSTRFSMADFLVDDTLFTQDPDGFIKFIYKKDSLLVLDPSSFVEIPIQPLIDNLPVPAGAPNLSVDLALASLGGMELENLEFDDLKFVWYLESPVIQPATLTLNFVNGRINGQNFQIVAQSQGQGRFEGEVQANDLILELFRTRNPAVNGYNNLLLDLSFSTGAGVLPGTLFNFGLRLDSNSVKRVSGNFGQRGLNLPSAAIQLDLGSITDFTEGFLLTDPKMRFRAYNKTGIEISVDALFNGVSSTGSPVRINLPNYQIGQAASVGLTQITDLELNRNNSTLVDFLESTPEQLIFSGSASLNPSSTSANNFLENDQSLVLSLELELPMELRTSGLRFEDFAEIDLGEDTELIDFLEIDIRSVNSFPLDVDLYIFLLDENDSAIDSLALPIVTAAPVDANGVVIAPITTLNTLILTDSQKRQLVNSKRWRVQGRLSTWQNGSVPVRIYSSYALDLDLGIRTRLNLSDN